MILSGMRCKIDNGPTSYEGVMIDIGTDFYESGNGNVGQFSVAIIMRDDGQLVTTSINNVQIKEIIDESDEPMGQPTDQVDIDNP
jgi:hypothetical protein